ncbi:MAG TPA: thrombospondin type 3 repeat-containing protein [Candidatus Kapabacteria bacterium]|nr:thrombospondin type 3 repeat-containing protein [Candidatus Kapabacteria bacterium]
MNRAIRTLIPILVAVIAAMAAPRPLLAQRTAISPHRQETLATDSTALVPAFRYIERDDHVTLNYSSLKSVSTGGGNAVATLTRTPNFSPNNCAARTLHSAVLDVKFDRNDDFEYAGTGNFLDTVKFQIKRINTAGGPSFFSSVTLKIDQSNPEQWYHLDFAGLLTAYDSTAQFVITVTDALVDANTTRDLRLTMSFHDEYSIDAHNSSNAATPLVAIDPIRPTNGIKRTNPVLFSWHLATGCSDTFPDYQFQILRLYNTDTSTAYTRASDAHLKTKATVDWSQALTVETGGSKPELKLTLAEGSGYYIWRVRPIGNMYPGDFANDQNWGVWSTSPPNDTVLNFTSPTDAGLPDYAFFYHQFDNDKNWTYTRAFSEGLRVAEGIAYSNRNLQPVQVQKKVQSGNHILVGQTVYDRSARPAVQSLSAPADSAELGYFGFIDGPIMSGQKSYRAEHFDDDANYDSPSHTDDGLIHNYYSSSNSDKTVGTAEGIPFVQTHYSPDGTGRPEEGGSIGDTLRIGGSGSGQSRTSRAYYSGVSSMELINMFGDEAPSDTSVYKVLRQGPNKQVMVEYHSKEGQVIATCQQEQHHGGLLVNNDYERPFLSEMMIRDTIGGRRSIDPYSFTSNKRLSFTDTTTITLVYKITPAELSETECVTQCTTCDYRVRLLVHDVDHPENTFEKDTLVPPASCGGAPTLSLSIPLVLPPGTYVVERILETNTADPASTAPGGSTYADEYRASVVSQVVNAVWGFDSLAKVKHYLDDGKLDSLYIYLNVDPEHDTVKVINGNCCPVRIPIIEPDCASDPCRDSVPNFERYLISMWGHTFGGNDTNNLNKYFRSGGGDQYPGGNGTYPNGLGAFNKLIANMLNETVGGNHVYDCSSLFNCWKALVDNYRQLATTDGDSTHLSNSFSLLESFLDCAGRRIVDTAHVPYDATRGYLLFAYKYINYNIGSNPDCQTYAGYKPAWHNNVDSIKQWDSLYQCIRMGIRTGGGTDVGGDIKSECEEGAGGNKDKLDACLLDLKSRIDGACDQVCDAHRDMYIGAILRGYAANNQSISWDHVICIADALVDSCKAMCQVTVTWDNGHPKHVTSIGAPGDADRMDTVYNFEPEIVPKGVGSCASGWRTYQGWTRDYKTIIVEYLNENLERFRRDTVGTGGGNWNFKRVLREIGIPSDILSTIGDSLVLVYPTDVSGRFELGGDPACELWYHADTTFLGTPASPHPMVSTLNNFLDEQWGFQVDEEDDSHIDHCEQDSFGIRTRIYTYSNTTLPPDYVDMRDGYFATTFVGINGSPSAQPLSDFFTYESPTGDHNLFTNEIAAFQWHSGDPYRIGFAQLKSAGVSGALQVQTTLEGICSADNLVYGGGAHEVLTQITLSDYWGSECAGHQGGSGDIPLNSSTSAWLDTYFSHSYTGYFGRFSEDADHYLWFNHYTWAGGGVSTSSRRYCAIRFFVSRDKRVATDVCETIECPAVCFRFVKPDNAVGHADTLRPENCRETAARKISESINRQISACAEARVGALKEKYIHTCSDPTNVKDLFMVMYPQDYFHFTLFYYDRVGNLVRTVQPKGMVTGTANRLAHPPHTFVSRYEYNSLGQPTWTGNLDGGEVRYWYDSKGRARFSMTLQQGLTGAYSYVKYDALGRIVERGRGAGGNQPGLLDGNVNVASFPAGGSERTHIVYSVPLASMGYLDGSPQHNLQNRVSYVYTDEGSRTCYSYDAHGNIEWVSQEIPGFNEPGTGVLRRNYTKYTYDLVSGNMNQVDYNEGRVDQFHHRYTHDADGRMVKVETSRDGQIWDRDAGYSYTPLGQLKRLELGEDKVQGMDYVYTPQGWLKAINHASLDSSKDPGLDAPTVNTYPADSFALELRYFNSDFKHTGSQFEATAGAGLVSPTPLYDGTISGAATNIVHKAAPGSVQYEGLAGETYRYDLLGRLDTSNFSGYNAATSVWTATADYRTWYRYDANGNIDTLHRNANLVGPGGSQTNGMDHQGHVYQAGTNRLLQVNDTANATRYSQDIDNQNANNYTYDLDGHLTNDVAGRVTAITWNNIGKVRGYTEPPVGPGGPSTQHTWTYDGFGDRVKTSSMINLPTGAKNITNEYYVRDAAGVVMAIYREICIVTPIVPFGPDTDGDGIPDASDNCPFVYNPLQSDIDHDGIGDECDTDIDGDGVLNEADNCPLVANASQNPIVCLGDADGDGILDGADPCPSIPNPLVSTDLNGNGIPDVCDVDYVRGNLDEWTRTDCSMTLAELPIYGLERVGTCKPNIPLSDTVPTAIFTRNLYKKEYELKDNLGSVRLMISDAKKARLSPSGAPGRFYADVLSFSNYYPFGMQQPSRGGSSSRYGYDDMERDAPTGNQYNTSFREYDPRLGRWWGNDPVTHPGESPYVAMGDNPVMMTDRNGADPSTSPGLTIKSDNGGPNPAHTPDGGIVEWGVGSDGRDYGRIRFPWGSTPWVAALVVTPDSYNPTVDLQTTIQYQYDLGERNPYQIGPASTSVGQPGPVEKYVPIWGNGRAAIDDFQNGNYGRGILHTLGAATDVFLAKSLLTAAGRITVETVGKDIIEESLDQATTHPPTQLTGPTQPLALPSGPPPPLALPSGPTVPIGEAADRILVADRINAALKADIFHHAPSFLSKEQLEAGTLFNLTGGDGIKRLLLQTEGEMNGKSGIFEYILDPNDVITHQRFIPGGRITGVPNQKVVP